MAERSDPFLITGPAVISFSGGRTSAYMLWRILQAHGGTLPDNVLVCFANTGREMPATLDFVRDCAAAWNVTVHWLEFRHRLDGGKTRRTRYAEEVSHNSASRAGEPFQMLHESKKAVPDRDQPWCSIQLKTLTIERWVAAEHGWSHWTNVIGFRADESVRISDKVALEAGMPNRRTTAAFPLAAAGIQKLDVMRFWRDQPFDLRLDEDGDGGNCDFCFHFSSDRLGRMFRKYPERGQWWIDLEAQGTKTMRPGQPYVEIRRVALNQGVLDWTDGTPCRYAGCGV